MVQDINDKIGSQHNLTDVNLVRLQNLTKVNLVRLHEKTF